ncbi:XkdQ/YqbQ family protein [Alkaliphilus metalliredigens]|nr:hypothetical protein [Alkaliphilus metalliredigens]
MKKSITALVGNLTWTSHESTLGVQLNFDTAYNNIIYFPKDLIDIGDVVVLSNDGNEVFRGIIVTEEINGEFSRHYIAFDYAFYLNKSKGVYQFNGIQASKAIEQLLNDLNIPVANIASITTIINHIYFDKVISDIIKDILLQATQETGQRYRLEMRAGKLYIENEVDLIVNATFKLAENIESYNVTTAISNLSRRRSIEEMKNSIIIISENGESIKTVGSAKESTSIQKYGLLQEVQSVDEKDISQANHIARTLLKDLNKIFEDNSVELIGNDSVRAGRIINISEPITGMNGQYKIKSCTHNVSNGIHKMSLDLGVL